jgi:hypothetical protein
MSGKLKPIYVAQNIDTAHLLKNLLEEAGIRALVSNDETALGGVLGWSTAPRVVVDEADEVAAAEIAQRFDKRAPIADLMAETSGPRSRSRLGPGPPVRLARRRRWPCARVAVNAAHRSR